MASPLKDEKNGIYRVVGGLMHSGNMTFKNKQREEQDSFLIHLKLEDCVLIQRLQHSVCYTTFQTMN